MSYQAIFSSKKKPQLQASGPTSQYANNPTSSQPAVKFGSSVMSGNGISAISDAVFPKLSFAKPAQNNASSQPNSSQPRPTSSQPIQASGMTSNYASNPSNYVASPAPKPEVKIQKPQDPTQGRLDDVMNTAKDMQSFAETARKQQEDYIRQKYQLANQQLQEQLPNAQNKFGEFKKNTEASIADLLAGGERQKANAKDYYGDAQRQAAQSRRQVQGKTQQTFANLGTLDSRGEGSFQQATENQDSDFNRFTQQTLRAQADKLSEIDAAVGQAERSARATITQEETKLNELERSIQYAMANNNLEEANKLTDAYNTTKQYIYEIQDSVSQMKYQFALEQQKLENEMAKVQTFSPEFMAGGKPTNQAEFEFMINNPKGFESAFGTGQTGGKLTEKQMAYMGAANIAQNALAKLNTGNISSGFGSGTAGKIGEILGTNSNEQQAYRSDIAAMRTAIQNALLGANMSPAEMAQVMAAIPQYNDAPNIAKSKLESLLINLPIMAGNGQQTAQQYGQDQIDKILASLGN